MEWSDASFPAPAADVCGFAGLLDPSGRRTAEELQDLAGVMADRLVHRGPDDRGTWCDRRAGLALGHRRLSVVDLSEAGHQPMQSADGTWAIAYNGELYNADGLAATAGLGRGERRGHSDTEVFVEALARLGVERTLEAAVGMFAFAAWDLERRELWLGRDRFGEKPLYHGRHDGCLVFGSELKALRAMPGFRPSIDHDSVADLVRLGCVPAPWTIYEGFTKVRPGHVERFDAAGRRLEEICYWSPVDAARTASALVPAAAVGEGAVDELAVLLGEVVGSRMVADVPLGAFLSGGIDSSTVVALMAARSSAPIRTFTVGFSEAAYDESPHARAVASHLGTDHHELVVSPADAREVIPTLPVMYDEPFADSSQIPTFLVSRLASGHVTVALSGDGGDELFGGYDRYRHLGRLRAVLDLCPGPVRRLAGRGLSSVPVSTWDRVGAGPLGRLGPAGVRRRLGHRAHKVARVLTADGPAGAYRSMMGSVNDPTTFVPRAVGRPELADGTDLGGRSGFEQAMLMDTLAYLPDDLLTKVDRASMSVSLEARVPLLDPDLFDLAWRLHPGDRFRDGRGKWVLRQLLHRYVPPELVERPKMGFGIPVGDWLRGPLRGWADDLLAPGLLSDQGFFAVDEVERAWRSHRSGEDDLVFQLWPILVFQAWLAEVRP